MANANLDALVREVSETEGILDSAIVFVEGVPGLIDAAIAAALANGATEAELAPLGQLSTDLDAKANALAAAISAHQPPV